MNKQERRGKAKEIEGEIREKVGKLTGNKKEQIKGRIQQTMGRADSGIAKLRRKAKAWKAQR